MALINYVEPVATPDMGGFLIGLAGMVFVLTFTYLIYRIGIKYVHILDTVLNKEIKYEVFEESFLDKIAKRKGIDLNKELTKKEIYTKARKSFRKQLEQQVYEEMFGKIKEEE
jgi:hypothetical protein